MAINIGSNVKLRASATLDRNNQYIPDSFKEYVYEVESIDTASYNEFYNLKKVGDDSIKLSVRSLHCMEYHSNDTKEPIYSTEKMYVYYNSENDCKLYDYAMISSKGAKNSSGQYVKESYYKNIFRVKGVDGTDIILFDHDNSSTFTVNAIYLTPLNKDQRDAKLKELSNIKNTESDRKESKEVSTVINVGDTIKFKSKEYLESAMAGRYSAAIINAVYNNECTVKAITPSTGTLNNYGEYNAKLTIEAKPEGWSRLEITELPCYPKFISVVAKTSNQNITTKEIKPVTMSVINSNDSALSVGDVVHLDAPFDYDLTDNSSKSGNFVVKQVGGNGLPNDRIVLINSNGIVVGSYKSEYITKLGHIQATSTTNNSNIELTNANVSDYLSKYGDTIFDSLTLSQGIDDNSLFGVTEFEGWAVQDMNRRPVAESTDDPEVPVFNNTEITAEEFWSNSKEYKSDYDRSYQEFQSDFKAIRKSLNIIDDNLRELDFKNVYFYNRFKLPTWNNYIKKSYSHVFFVRPDLNLIQDNAIATDDNLPLHQQFKGDGSWVYASKNCPNLIRELTQQSSGFDNEFMMLLSSRARGFQVNDESIEDDGYGTTLTGYNIHYGKSNIKSKVGGNLSINYNEDKSLSIYKLHKLWTDYISDTFRGKYTPKLEYIKNKIIDYATCVYYFICDEDGETILFWSKYWGVFPVNSPSSNFSYTAGNVNPISNEEMRVDYKYSWKEDFNPLSIVEFNTHSNKLPWTYTESYNPNTLTMSQTWGGAPFIEVYNGNDNLLVPYTYKLRFRPSSESNYNKIKAEANLAQK